MSATAQDYYYVSRGPTSGLPDTVQAINWQDRDGDRADYQRTGLPMPSALPALVDARTGYSVSGSNITSGISNLCARALATSYDAATNYQAAAGRVTGGGTKISDLRKANKKAKADDAIEALTARIAMIEAMLKQRGIMTPGAALQEDKP